MKDIKDIASILNVSRVTVYNHLKKLDKEIEAHTFKKKGITYVDDEGIKLLKISMGLIELPTIRENISIENIVDDISSMVSDNLKGDISSLIASSLEEYNQDLKKEMEALKEQNNKLIELLEEKESKSFLSKLKGLFKS